MRTAPGVHHVRARALRPGLQRTGTTTAVSGSRSGAPPFPWFPGVSRSRNNTNRYRIHSSTRREQYVLPWYRVRLSRERARRLVRCYELGQASVLVFQIFMGVAPYKRVKKPSCATWSCGHRSYTNRTQAPRNALASLEPRKTSHFPRPALRLSCCN